jgi:calcium-dependent protein kinase
MKKSTGSSFYMAPEVILGHYNHKCDIWSFGIVAFVLLLGRFPYDAENEEKVLEKIIKD